MSSQPAILFDLDGVLVDSRAPITNCLGHALKAQGLPSRSPTSLERFIGPPLALVFAELTGHDKDSELVYACITSYLAHYQEASLRETAVFPSIPGVLEILSGSYRLAIATSKSKTFAKPLLAALDLSDNFEHVAAPDLSDHAQGKETTIGSALVALGTTHAVMVGDRSFDVLGAHACGIPAVGVTWGIGNRQELAGAGADVIIDDPKHLPQAVNGLLAI